MTPSIDNPDSPDAPRRLGDDWRAFVAKLASVVTEVGKRQQ